MYLNYDGGYSYSIESSSRKWSVSRVVYFNNGSWASIPDAQKHLKNFVISDYSSDNSNITMGYVAGGKLSLNFKTVSAEFINYFKEGNQLVVYLSLKNNQNAPKTSTLVTFPCVVDEVKVNKRTTGQSISVTAYDLSYVMTHEYITSLENPTAIEMISEIADKYGLTVDNSVSEKIRELGENYLSERFTPLKGFTCKQTLGYLAGCFGCNARINASRKISFEWYEPSTMPEIKKQNVYLDGATISKNVVIKLIETGTKDNPIVYPDNANGVSINFENPYITSELARRIYEKKIANDAISFRTGKIKYRGNPINMSGKIVETTDIDGSTVNFYIMKRTLNYDGGLSETIECFGESETTISFKITSPTQQKIDRALSRMEEAIKNATDIIIQTKGSIFELIPIDENNPSKGNSGWKLYSTEIGRNNLIMANSSGIGFSSNGGQSFNAMALYIDENGIGHINANCIDVGKLSASVIDTSTLVVGGGNYDDLESLLNGVVDTANNSVTKVDVLYGKNQSTTTPPTNWSTDAPVWENGYYIWTKTQTTAGGVTSETQPVCITGAKGQTGLTGATGAAGANGEDGLGISKIEEQYYLSTSSTSVTGGSWSTNQPAWAKNKYIWTRSKVTWEDNTVTYTDAVLAKAINGANETANTASSNASNALSVANSVNGVIANWCYENDTTVIDGAKIYTGSITAKQIAAESITADKLAVGAITADKIAVGDLTNYIKVNAISYKAFGFDTIENFYPNTSIPTTVDWVWLTPVEYKTQYYLGDWVDFSYNKEGDNKFLYQGQFYNTRSNTYAYFCVNVMLDNGVTHVFNQGTGTGDVYCYGSGVHSFSKTIALGTSYGGHRVIKIRPMIYFSTAPTATYWFAINEVTFRRATAGDITAGKLQSVDGKTYFDLDTGEVALKASNGDFVANFASSKLEYAKDTTLIGGIEGVTYESINRLAIYSPSIVNIGVGNDASSAAGSGLYISKDDVGSTLPIYALNGLYTKNIWSDGLIEFSGEDRSEFIRLNRSFADTNNAFKNYSAQLNLGITGFTDRQGNKQVASFHLNSSYNSNENTYMYFSHDFYEAKGCLYFAKGDSSNRSADLALGTTDIWFNGNSLINSSSEKYKTNIAVYDDKALNIVNDSKIYTYKYISDLKRANGAKTKYGLIIERECPTEIVDNSGDAISLYSMCSILWKAVQELSNEVRELKAVKNNA